MGPGRVHGRSARLGHLSHALFRLTGYYPTTDRSARLADAQEHTIDKVCYTLLQCLGLTVCAAQGAASSSSTACLHSRQRNIPHTHTSSCKNLVPYGAHRLAAVRWQTQSALTAVTAGACGTQQHLMCAVQRCQRPAAVLLNSRQHTNAGCGFGVTHTDNATLRSAHISSGGCLYCRILT